MLRRYLGALLLVVPFLANTSGGAQASGSGLNQYFTTCATYSSDGERICSGVAPSFDGAPLDFDLTFPMNGGARHPLIVMPHGFGNTKHEWESVNDTADNADKYHWNSHWFAEHGFFVLTYTARGFDDHGAGSAWQPKTPAPQSGSDGPRSTPPDNNGTLHLKSKEFEIRDTQWLAALAAQGNHDLDSDRVAVSGGSYGGGESWLQASQADWAFPHAQLSALPVLHLQVAVPKYPWTDLAYSLAPSGHKTNGDIYQAATLNNPLGVVKNSYTSGFYAEGNADGTFDNFSDTTPSKEGPISVAEWFNRAVVQGDPYDAGGVDDPIVAQMRRGLTEFRSSYYQADGWAAEKANRREVAVYSISGWTDNLFPPVESFRQFIYLKNLDPRWPVDVAVADIGHPLAQNPPEQWQYLNQQAWNFLSAHLGLPATQQPAPVTSLLTQCGSAGGGLGVLTASTPQGLDQGTLAVRFAKPGSLDSASGQSDPDNANTDPVLVSQTGQPACRTSTTPTATGRYTDVSSPLPSALTYAGLGLVRVSYQLTGLTAPLEARLWDVAPDGTTRLVTRGAYRIDPPFDASAGTLELPLFGNQWVFQAGHRLRLDLTESDSPAFLASHTASSVSFAAPVLVLPLHEAVSETLPRS